MNTSIIKSLLDTDFYKFSMWQFFYHRFPNNRAKYSFVCRNDTAYPLGFLIKDIKIQLDRLCALRFSDEDLAYLNNTGCFKPDFLNYLKNFKFNRKEIIVQTNTHNSLEIHAQGPQISVMGFEIYILAIVNELYFNKLKTIKNFEIGQQRLFEKIKLLRHNSVESPLLFSDFGTRRRFSFDWQQKVLQTLLKEIPSSFKGTSNVYFSKMLGTSPIGTMAHEYLQTFQVLSKNLRQFQVEALYSWLSEYQDKLAIALTDVINLDTFLKDFDYQLSTSFEGVRHDSGDPFVFGNKVIAHYESKGINPLTKKLIFSDGLTFDKAFAIKNYFDKRIKVFFGIGTHLTNDLGIQPLNIVMKVTEVNNQPVAKISDSPGKSNFFDAKHIKLLKETFSVS